MKKFHYLAILFMVFVFASCESNESNELSVFSVSANKKVTFSPGNLQYHPKNDKWRFAPNQYDCIGWDNKNISSNYDGWIDLFGWGTGNNPTNSSTFESKYQKFTDWGINKIDGESPNAWRTLTYDEWYYLIFERPNSSMLWGIAQVVGVNGLILLPDNWVCPKRISFKSGSHEKIGEEYYAEYQNFNRIDWKKMEDAGAIFLPAADARMGNFISFEQYRGFYWSSTCLGAEYAWSLCIMPFNVSFPEFNTNVASGLSVRLVQDVK